MRYAIGAGGWPVGQFLIPAGTIIDSSDNVTDESRLAAGRVPPLNSQALDQEAYDAMVVAYPGLENMILTGPNVNTSPQRRR